jgi:hypothetical protein
MDIEFICPMCNGIFIINEKDFNCCIIRHGVLKNNMTQINPHASKEECEYLIKNDLIYGCGIPLKIIEKDNKWSVIIIGYE